MSRFYGNRRGGFTALEIVIVLMILSIFSTFAILSYQSYKKQARLRSAAQSLQSTLSTARMLSINQNTNFQVRIDINNGNFWIDRLDGSGRIVKPKVTGVNWLPDDVLFTEVQKNGASVYSGIIPILFRANGTSEYTSIYIVGANTDTSIGENYFTIRIYPSTGLTHTYKNQRR
ncbi:MAG: prepilin-type N-terminal cleavage/methylation domain-containing protein [Candidatus Sumerlaeota bacterium]|nr:prepilin-type N-terminal cleavage/methylation domain-containing protein [Candidatus Sumerlaeota bacterium]